MATRKDTAKAKTPSEMAAYNVSPGNFWDVGNFSRCSKRITDSNVLLDDLTKMFAERAEIEAKYSKKLTDWHTRWSKYIESSPATYATMKTAQLGTLQEASDRAKIHMDCWGKIHNQVVEAIKRQKESKYHKAFVGIKEAKELEDEYTKAQKPWAGAYTKVQKAKKNYHAACKQMESTQMAIDQAKKDAEIPELKIKKMEQSLDNHETNVYTMKKKYEEKLSRIEPINISYENEMQSVYIKFAKGEEERKDFLQRMLVEFHKAVNICEDYRLKECFDNQINAAYSGKSTYDVTWWSENFGAEMPRNWPKFEVYSSSEWSHWSSYSLSSVQKKQSRRYTTRPRAQPYNRRPLNVVREHVPNTRKIPNYLDNDKFNKEETRRKVSLVRPIGSLFGLSSGSESCNFSFEKSREKMLRSRNQVSFSLPSVESPSDNEKETFAQRNRSRSLGAYSSYNNEPIYTSVDLSDQPPKELGDVPDQPAPISAVQPPDSTQYSSSNFIPRSASSQLQSPAQKPPQQAQMPKNEPSQVYQPSEDPDSNPFMNGDDGDDGDGEDDWDEPPPLPGGGIPVRALYDYSKVEEDELSFKANDVLTKLTEEDEQGWCRGRLNGVEGLYPANYVEAI